MKISTVEECGCDNNISCFISDHMLDTVEWNDANMYQDINKLKEKNPKLKILLSVGGYNHENGKTSKFWSISMLIYKVNLIGLFVTW